MSDGNFVDYYKLLEVESTSSNAEIKQKFLELAKKFHPDKGGDEKHFQQITQAYENLSKKSSRAQYDQKYIQFKLKSGLLELNELTAEHTNFPVTNTFLKLKQEFIEFSKQIQDSDLSPLENSINIEPINQDQLSNNMENLKLERELLDIENCDIKTEEPKSTVTIFQQDMNSLFGKWDSTSTELLPLDATELASNINFGELTSEPILTSEALKDTKLSNEDIENFILERKREFESLYKK
jgi:hypothetical protein